jgi:hypothetical protein
MITIFGDFSQFLTEKIGVFRKNLCYDHFFSKTSSSFSKNAKFFGENI